MSCDVVIGTGGEVWINGNLITRVSDIRVEQDRMTGTTMDITLHPTSVMYGEIPKSQVEQIRSSAEETVDIDRAMRKAAARTEGKFDARKVMDRKLPGPRGKDEMGS